jgi:N-acetylglucosaminyldiphosphoundecaprenol N-acetyl-beta-D-mannosaminyltransferase
VRHVRQTVRCRSEAVRIMNTETVLKEFSLRRYYVGKMGISAITMAQTVELLTRLAERQLPAYVCAANLEATALAQHDVDFLSIQNRSLVTIPDGMPLVWYARILGERGVQRVTGPDLMTEILRISSRRGLSHYFYGDTQETLAALETTITQRFPGTIVKGTHSPPFRELTDAEMEGTLHEINRLRPSFVWIALGCPKQEKWMVRAMPRVESSILVGVGAAFRFLIGHYRHPPRLIQWSGLEGAFWRAWRYPVENAKWYLYHIPVCAAFLLEAAAKRWAGERCRS